MKILILLPNVIAGVTLLFSLEALSAPTYMRLIDKLDRPQDGYCLDVVGSGPYIRVDMPLTAHNCKGPQPFDDEIVEMRENGTLYFPRYNGCVTVMGNNQQALPGNALMLKRCGEERPFLNGPRFQRFVMNASKQLQLAESELCIVAGSVSATTYSTEHKWRNLSVEICESAEPSLSRWESIVVGQSHE